METIHASKSHKRYVYNVYAQPLRLPEIYELLSIQKQQYNND